MLRQPAGMIFLLLCQCAAAEETAHVKCWGQSEVKVIAKPAENAATIATLACGDEVKMLEQTGDWGRVRTAKNEEGFVAVLFLSTAKSGGATTPEPAKTEQAIVEKCRPGSKVRVYRSGFSVFANGTVPCGATVTVEYWKLLLPHIITAEGLSGYLDARHIRRPVPYKAPKIRPLVQHEEADEMNPKTDWGQLIANIMKSVGETMMPPEQAAVYHDCDNHGGVAQTGTYTEIGHVTADTPLGPANGTVTTTKYYALCKDGTRVHN